MKKGASIKCKLSKIMPDEFDKFTKWLELCYNIVCKEIREKDKVINIGIDFQIYEITGDNQ